MAAHYLEFERPIAELEAQIEELSTLIRVGAPVQFLKKPTPAARS